MRAHPNVRGLVRSALGAVCLLAAVLTTPAALVDVMPTDVTTRAFSVVWAADEPIASATVRVFSDAAGTTEITDALTVTLVAPQAALDLGLGKIDVTGLAADTCYYWQVESTGAVPVQSPAAPPFPEVCTALSTTKATAAETPIVNDLIVEPLSAPDGVTPGDGMLLVLSLPALGAYPVSSFAGENAALPSAAVDLGNVHDATSGTSAEPATGDVLRIRHFRGLHCADPDEQALVRYRRVPAHDELPTLGAPIVELEAGDPCFFADTECDDTIDILDAQRVLNAFDSQSGDCRFQADLDIVADQEIDVLDLQSVLNRFGQSAPFP